MEQGPKEEAQPVDQILLLLAAQRTQQFVFPRVAAVGFGEHLLMGDSLEEPTIEEWLWWLWWWSSFFCFVDQQEVERARS